MFLQSNSSNSIDQWSKNNADVLAFLCRCRAVCTPLFLLSNRTVFPIDFISILLNYFCQKSLRFYISLSQLRHKTPQNRIRARNFTKPLFAQSIGKLVENWGLGAFFVAFQQEKSHTTETISCCSDTETAPRKSHNLLLYRELSRLSLCLQSQITESQLFFYAIPHASFLYILYIYIINNQ